MIIDLLHNQIVNDTITEGFKKSVAENLVPGLVSVYGEDMLGIQMYEDHLADEFLLDGVFYYPMTVIKADEQVTHWVAWNVTEGEFTDMIPYSYVGAEGIAFDLSPVVPIDFETAIIGRSRYCEGGLIKINVHSTSPSATFLAGKYSQTFIDEMARQLTVAISEVASVEGLAESGLELQLEFSPITFMEHNSENVTYRRLLLTDGASMPRDFWVKWINHRTNAPFTVSDHTLSDEIEFLIGEGVPQKIREREYRHLIRTNADKYQSSMGKRNITEWRDLIKRAIKHGKLTRVIREIPLDDEVILVNAALANAAGLSTADVVSAGPAYEEDAASLDLATELAKAAGLVVDTFIDEPDDEAIAFDEEPVSEEPGIDEDLLALINHNKELVAHREEEESDEEEIEIELEVELDDEDLEDDLDEDLDEELEDIDDEEFEDELDEIEDEEAVLDEEYEEEPIVLEDESVEPELIEEIEENTVITPEILVETESEELCKEAEDADIEEPVEEVDVETVAADEPVVEAEENGEYQKPTPDLAEIEERLREGLEAKIRLEYEKQARATAENEMIELRRKHEQLLIENRRLEAQAKKEYEERRRISEQRKLENDRLRAEIETKIKSEAREKERLAEAARMAVEEKHRLERERLEAERRRIEDERRMAEDRARAEAEARLEAERQLEAERIRRAAKPEVEAPVEEAPENKYAHYTYIAKNVKLLFRYSVDPNITVRIQEILAATLKHYDKSDLHIRVRATVPDNSSVVLEFLEFPKQEMELLYEIIKILGASGIGIAKAILEDPKK